MQGGRPRPSPERQGNRIQEEAPSPLVGEGASPKWGSPARQEFGSRALGRRARMLKHHIAAAIVSTMRAVVRP